MKLTKERLKIIIKEEMNELMGMMGEPPGKSKEEALQEIMALLQPLEHDQLAVMYTNIQQMLSGGMLEQKIKRI